MRWIVIVLFSCLSAPLTASVACDDLWLTRNQVMDRAGYCFGSVLGQAMFDNSDCTGQQVQLSSYDMETVQQVRALEAQIGCRVDTSRTWLSLMDINFRHALTSYPVLDELPGMCRGWLGPQTPLYAGHQEPFRAIGQILPGDDVGYDHLSVGDWSYVTVHVPFGDGMKSAGWLYAPQSNGCREFIP